MRGVLGGRGVAFLLVLAATPLSGQQEAAPVMDGRVVRDGQPHPEAVVVLHRVTPDTAGEIDTVRVDASGRFRFDLPSVPDPGGRGEVYFASVRHLDILYFGRAIHRAAQLDSLYTIEVHDTTVVPAGGAEIPLQIRYVIAERVDGSWRTTDLFQLRNEGDRTLVPRADGAVWAYPLPSGATDFQMGTGDLPPDAAALENGVFRVSAPVPPGDRQLVVRYTLDDDALRFPLPGTTRQMELLVREPAPPLEVEGLEAVQAVELEPGVTYRRYMGTGLVDGRVVARVGDEGGGLPVRWIAVLTALVLGVAGLYAVMKARGDGRRAPAPAGGVSGGPGRAAGAAGADARERLLLDVARLDEALEDADLPPDEAGHLRERRSELIRRLQDSSAPPSDG